MADFVKKYNPTRSADWNYGGAKWRLSRSKIDLFLECPRCFWVDNKLGTKRPGFPAFNLNLAVDELFKKEFDVFRAKGTAHPIMSQYQVDAVPFQHEKLDAWRDPFMGVEYREPETNLLVCGGVDDLWVKPDGGLIIVDYKATSKDGRIEALGDSPWEQQYARQLGVYKWLLENNGFKVNDLGYLVYANADKSLAGFDNKLVFDTTLVPVTIATDWILPTLRTIKNTLTSETIPASGQACEYCPYREAVGTKLLTIHRQQLKK